MVFSDPEVSDGSNPHIVCPPGLMPRGLEGNERENMGEVLPIVQVQSLLTSLPQGTLLAPASGNSCWAVSYF